MKISIMKMAVLLKCTCQDDDLESSVACLDLDMINLNGGVLTRYLIVSDVMYRATRRYS